MLLLLALLLLPLFEELTLDTTETIAADAFITLTIDDSLAAEFIDCIAGDEVDGVGCTTKHIIKSSSWLTMLARSISPLILS